MARKIILSLHVSLDGYVAGPAGEMDWIRLDDELFNFVATIAEPADTALYGRNTWQMMEGYWPTADQQPNATVHDRTHAAWYRRVTRIVVSDSMKGQELPQTRIFSGDIAAQVQELKKSPGGDIMIFGSPSAIQPLIEHGLIDDFHLFVNPVVLNNGIPVFQQDERIQLKLEGTKTFGCGVVWMHYRLR